MPDASTRGMRHSSVPDWPSSPATGGSPNVSIAGEPALRLGDSFADGSTVTGGSASVFINGKAAARMGDPVSCGAVLEQGCPTVKIGNGGAGFAGPLAGVDPEAGREAAFAALRRVLAPRATEKDKLLLCLPDIAAAMAARQTSENERQGWLYQRAMLIKWLMGSVNSDAKKDNDPFWIDWDWVMGLERHIPVRPWLDGFFETSPADEYEKFIYPFYMPPEPDAGWAEPTHNIYNNAAKRSLGDILLRDGFLKSHAESFNFIDTCWPEWAAKYHTQRKAPQPYGVNAQQAALGSFHFRALADGWSEPSGTGRHMIHVTRAAVFVYDVFSFAPGEIEWLGYWSCEHRDVLTPLLGVLDDLLGENFNFWDAEPPPPGYALLQNADFRDYQARLRQGHDYLVFSQPHAVENFQAFSYEYPL